MSDGSWCCNIEHIVHQLVLSTKGRRKSFTEKTFYWKGRRRIHTMELSVIIHLFLVHIIICRGTGKFSTNFGLYNPHPLTDKRFKLIASNVETITKLQFDLIIDWNWWVIRDCVIHRTCSALIQLFFPKARWRRGLFFWAQPCCYIYKINTPRLRVLLTSRWRTSNSQFSFSFLFFPNAWRYFGCLHNYILFQRVV